MASGNSDSMLAISDLKDFDRKSGSRFERLIFNNRVLVVIFCVLATLVLGWQPTSLTLNAAFEKTIPRNQPYIKNFLDNRNELRGLGNAVRIVVQKKAR